MPKPVSLKAIVDALDLLHDESTAYVNTKTGEVYSTLGETDADFEDDDGSDDESAQNDPADWKAELRNKRRQVESSEDWIALPTKFDIDDYAIMEKFCVSVSPRARQDQLLDAISDRGAFRMFRSTVRRLGLMENWHAFRNAELKRIAMEWCREHGISYEP